MRAAVRGAGLLVVLIAALIALAATPAAASQERDPRPDPVVQIGYDVSYPQCGFLLPQAAAFAVVGVDGGRVRKPNPCLVEQLSWALSANEGPPAYYLNTANPGPLVSSYWPLGQQEPRVCADAYPESDSVDCSYDYGWNAAADSWERLAEVTQRLDAPDPEDSTWWLDVETGNTWEALLYGGAPDALDNDTAALHGMVDFLRTRGVIRVGLYSTARQWQRITGGASMGGLPVWYAGTSGVEQATNRCAGPSFTGGPVLMAQYGLGAFDANLRC